MSGPVITLEKVETRDKPRGQWVYPEGRYARPYRQRDETNVKTRLYLWPSNESVIENFLVGRHTRPVGILRLAIPAIFAELKIGPYKARWSRKAGCSCGCSPAFIIDARLGYDIFATVKFDQPPLTPNQVVEVARRIESWEMDPTLPSLVAT